MRLREAMRALLCSPTRQFAWRIAARTTYTNREWNAESDGVDKVVYSSLRHGRELATRSFDLYRDERSRQESAPNQPDGDHEPHERPL